MNKLKYLTCFKSLKKSEIGGNSVVASHSSILENFRYGNILFAAGAFQVFKNFSKLHGEV